MKSEEELGRLEVDQEEEEEELGRLEPQLGLPSTCPLSIPASTPWPTCWTHDQYSHACTLATCADFLTTQDCVGLPLVCLGD